MNPLSTMTDESSRQSEREGDPQMSAANSASVIGPADCDAVRLPPIAIAQSPAFAYFLWLMGAAGVLSCAALLQVGQDREVVFPWIGCPVPETCAMHTRLGVDCPGCGLTRSFVHLAHGNVMGAWSLSPVSLLVFSFVVLQVPLSLLHLFRIGGHFLRRWTHWNQFIFVGLLIAILLQWTWRLVTGDLF